MGTRARVNVIEDGKVLVSIYRQMDGYPEGLGQDVAEFTARLKLVNGLGGDISAVANGMGCYAAQLISFLKDGAGSVYIRPTNMKSHGEEYVYAVYENEGELWIRASAGRMTMFGWPGDPESKMKLIYDGPAKSFCVPEKEESAA